MEQWIIDTANSYPVLVYLAILAWTFLEGETVVLVTGALISGSEVGLSVWTLILFAFMGSFGGDQTWFYIGRKYGTPLLNRWPTMADKAEWAFGMLRRNQILFILSFRFIYGVRNISPFLIGISGVGRVRFALLNCIAAFLWACAFAWGGYFLGTVLEEYLGKSKVYVLLGVVALALGITAYKTIQQRKTKKEA